VIASARQFHTSAVVIVAVAALSASTYGQVSSGLALNGIAHVAFRVSDIQNSREFYQKLGFEQAFELSKAGKTTEAFMKINDRQFVELYPPQEGQALGLMHVCFEAADLALLNQEYVKRGLTPSPARKAGAGNLLFTLHDREGQLLEYTQYMPGSMHSNDHGKHLGTHRISDHLLGATAAAVRDLSSEHAFYVDKLGFGSASEHGGEIRLRLPGHSGEEIMVESAAEHPKPTLIFAVGNLKQAIDSLRGVGISAKTAGKATSANDPDGNIVVFEQQ
jgi:catechol 2,3-dioxygenase-like lactoylglutathione lyase family enzyme